MMFKTPTAGSASVAASLIAVMTLLGGTAVRAAESGVTRNPLFTVAAGQFQDKHGGLHAGAAGDAGPVLVNVRAGDWAKFAAFDFDSGVAGFRIESATQGGVASIEIRLDKPDGPLLGQIGRLPSSKTADNYLSASCKVDNGQAGVRDVYLVFGGDASATTAVQLFVFQKSLRDQTLPPDLAKRVDTVDNEIQAKTAWGVPEVGLSDDFHDFSNWQGSGFSIVNGSAVADGKACAFTPNAYINKTDTGGAWRTMAQATLSADITADADNANPGIGFTSADGTQSVTVVLDFAENVLRAERQLAGEPPRTVRTEPKLATDPDRKFRLEPGKTYRLRIAWSPYSNGMMAFLSDPADPDGKPLADFRTVIDLPAARRPLLTNSGGKARFSHVVFDPKFDGWQYRWQFLKTPALDLKDVCNPAVWKWTDGKYYMVWRKFGADTFHGVATSDDAIHWTQVTDKVMKCTGDMNVLVDPFGDGRVYCTPGGNNMTWFVSDGSDRFANWKDSGKKLGDIHGFSRIQEIIDTTKHPQMRPVEFGDRAYRFIAFVEDWTRAPRPHTSVMLSNTLTEWTLADRSPVLPPRDDFWGEKGSAIGSAIPLPNGDILLASCSCTAEGYTGAPEPTNVSLIVDGKKPWVIKKLATLPDAPVSRENVWYQGPNFATAFLYEPLNDTLYLYGGFHDYSIGMMRVPGFLHGQSTGTPQR